jgi:dTMP kinase
MGPDGDRTATMPAGAGAGPASAATPIIGTMSRTTAPPGILIAAEGLDGSGKSATLELLARWLERKGRIVDVVPWEPSPHVRRAARDPRSRHLLAPRVEALLGAVDAVRIVGEGTAPLLAAGHVVLADRYAWTAVAREVARGVDPAWAAALYRSLPRPDVVLLLRQEGSAALRRALSTRPASTQDEATASAFGDFIGRLVAAFDALAEGAEAGSGPWPVRATVLDAAGPPDLLAARARDAVRHLLARREDAA